MKCITCDSDRIIDVFAHSKDLGTFTYDKLNISHEGYFPKIDGICFGDDADITLCVECGQIQADFPITDETIKAEVNAFYEDYDDEILGIISKQPTYMVQPFDSAPLEIINPSELYNLPCVADAKEQPGFASYVYTKDPVNGEMLVAIYCDNNDVVLQGLAFAEKGFLHNLPDVEWSDFEENKV